MITVYLTAFPTLYEGEDIEIRYCLYQNDVLLKKETVYLGYVKPAVVGISSVLALLGGMESYKEEEIKVFINDGSLSELLKGSSTTKNADVLKSAAKMKKQLAGFTKLSFINVTKDKNAFVRWKEVLEG